MLTPTFFLRALLAAALCHQPVSAAPDPAFRPVIDALAGHDARIDSITAYLVPVEAERKFSYAVQNGRLHAFIRFSAGGKRGWTELKFPELPASDLATYATRHLAWFGVLQGKTVAEALQDLTARRPKDFKTLEVAEMALLDLAGKLTGRPAMELLGLTRRDPVPGLYCILTDDPEQVRRMARLAIQQGMTTHLKVKLYGKVETDEAVVRAAREAMGTEAYLVGDVNYGYRKKYSDKPVDGVAAHLKRLHAAGLSACEDPARMSAEQWAGLQRVVGDLDLLPDAPLRPAWDAPKTVNANMGRVFNMHPAGMGSIVETVKLGRLIQSWNRKLMVGDDSLVGPACPAWTQIAIGLGADWVEAVEKPQESDVFPRCVTKNPLERGADGRFMIREELPGWGLEIDEEELRKLAAETIDLDSTSDPAKPSH